MTTGKPTSSAPPHKGRPAEQRTGSTGLDSQTLTSAALDTPKIDRWSPANTLETLPDGDFEYRWVAESVNGMPTPSNVQKRLQQGYERVMRHEVDTIAMNEDDGTGFAKRQGLILMKLPKNFAAQRDAYYADKSAERARTIHEMHGNAIPEEMRVHEDRGSRALKGADAGRALHNLANK